MAYKFKFKNGYSPGITVSKTAREGSSTALAAAASTVIVSKTVGFDDPVMTVTWMTLYGGIIGGGLKFARNIWNELVFPILKRKAGLGK